MRSAFIPFLLYWIWLFGYPVDVDRSTTFPRCIMNVRSSASKNAYGPISWFPNIFPPASGSIYTKSSLVMSWFSCLFWRSRSLLYRSCAFYSFFLPSVSVCSISLTNSARWSISTLSLHCFSTWILNPPGGFVKTNWNGACPVLRCIVKLYAYFKA